MKPLLPIAVLPLLLAACASTTNAAPPSVVDEPPAIWAPPPQPESLGSTDAKPSTSAARASHDLSKTGPADASAASGGTTTDANQAPPSAADASAFPERRAIEALDVLARSIPLAHDKRGAVMTLPCDELFEPGSATLTAGARWQLDEIAPALAQQDGREIHVRGYTDSLGDRAENDALSLRRAEAVRDYVVGHGAHAQQIQVEGLGPAHPVADNGTALGRAANRRIEIVIRAPRANAAR